MDVRLFTPQMSVYSWRITDYNHIPVKSHGFAVSLTIWAMKSRSHAVYVMSHAFQLKQILRK